MLSQRGSSDLQGARAKGTNKVLRSSSNICSKVREDLTMPHEKQTSKRKRLNEAVPVVGVVGVSLSLAGGASAATAVPTADTPSRTAAPHQITLSEEEIADV